MQDMQALWKYKYLKYKEKYLQNGGASVLLGGADSQIMEKKIDTLEDSKRKYIADSAKKNKKVIDETIKEILKTPKPGFNIKVVIDTYNRVSHLWLNVSNNCSNFSISLDKIKHDVIFSKKKTIEAGIVYLNNVTAILISKAKEEISIFDEDKQIELAEVALAEVALAEVALEEALTEAAKAKAALQKLEAALEQASARASARAEGVQTLEAEGVQTLEAVKAVKAEAISGLYSAKTKANVAIKAALAANELDWVMLGGAQLPEPKDISDTLKFYEIYSRYFKSTRG